MRKYKLVTRFRNVKYFFYKNWYGIRHGAQWSLDHKDICLLDLGAITLGYEKQ